jgi:hypothetical protein
MYKLLNNPMTGQPSPFILRTTDNAYIPIDEANSDYQAYLAWIAEGNTPLSAENE